eukprot:2388650-Pyramimonas_sp.AAC.1
MEYSKCRALNGILVSTVELKLKAFLAVDSGACSQSTIDVARSGWGNDAGQRHTTDGRSLWSVHRNNMSVSRVDKG